MTNSKLQTPDSRLFKIKLRVGDTVMVRTGAQKGKTGKVTAVHPKLNKVTVEGVNVVKRHTKRSRQHPKGAILEKTVPIWVSKVGIVHPTTKNKTSRIGQTVKKDGTKVRVYRQAGNKEIK
jgi:large subunit ribosomal protein L24